MTSHNEKILVSIVIVTFNSKEELPQCLDSISKQIVRCEVFVVDNASTDGTQDFLGNYRERWPSIKIRVILNKENRGLAYGNNQPLPISKGEYVLFLNPDTILKPDTLKLLAGYLDTHPDVGVVGPKSYFEDESPFLSFQSRWTIFHMLLWRIGPYGIIRNLYDKYSNYKESDVLFVSGACLMIRRDLLMKIGGYDNLFFLSIDDVVDLCLRVKENGYRVVFYPGAVITHLGGRSYKSTPYIAMYYSVQGSLYFLKKHKGRFWVMLVKACYIGGTILKASLAYFLWIISLYKNQSYKRISDDNFRLARKLFDKQFQV